MLPESGVDIARERTGELFFDSAAVENLIADYQRTGSVTTLGEVMSHCQSIPLSLIRSRATARYVDEGELMSVVTYKLLRSLPQFDRGKGSAFSFVSRLSLNMLATSVTHSRKLAGRYSPLDEVLAATVPDLAADSESAIAVADLIQQIRSIKSAIELEPERQAQKWYVESFLDAGFELRRHECADAAMKVYGLSHGRSRQLYDLTLLEIRRLLWDETKHAAVNAQRLRNTRSAALVRYVNFLSPAEFSKFALLMKDLAPTLVILVRPANKAAIGRGKWAPIRQNLELILAGDPAATTLFGS